MNVFLDTNLVIYLIEQPPVWGARTSERIRAIRNAGDSLALSELVRMECRVGTLARNDVALLAQYDAFFQGFDILVAAISRAVCDRSTQIRVTH